MSKKILALLMIVTMIVTVVPFTAFAADTDRATISVTKINSNDRPTVSHSAASAERYLDGGMAVRIINPGADFAGTDKTIVVNFYTPGTTEPTADDFLTTAIFTADIEAGVDTQKFWVTTGTTANSSFFVRDRATGAETWAQNNNYRVQVYIGSADSLQLVKRIGGTADNENFHVFNIVAPVVFDGGSSGGGSFTNNPGQSDTGGGDDVIVGPGGTAIVFNDLASVESWAGAAIRELVAAGIINGTGPNTYEPTRNINRQEFVKIVVGVFGITPTNGQTGFSDVNSSEWYNEWIFTAKQEGLVMGYSDDIFGIDDPITREQAATIIHRAMVSRGYTLAGNASFTDAESFSSYAAEAIAALGGSGVIAGYPEGDFRPANNLTRAEAAVLLHRVFANYVKADTDATTEEAVEDEEAEEETEEE